MGADVVLQSPSSRTADPGSPIADPRSTADVPSVVELEAVSYAYSGVTVIDAVSLRIARGESVALVGRSGAGKSTILKLINRLLLPDSGVVRVEGRDTREWDPILLRRRTGYVLQSIGLFPHLTVEENVTIVPRLEGWDASRRRARARELLDLVGLPPPVGARWPQELSGGQQQRVGVARALAVSPPVLLMDEPFGALDAITRRELQQLVQRIQRELTQTIVLVTHDIVEAGVLGTRIGVVDGGVLVTCDRPDAVWASSDPRVRQLLDAVQLPAVRH
jgi:osmoprotectant transport system ATP-binding protein